MHNKITFIGAGNMASAIFGGLIDSGYTSTSITATSPSDEALQPLRERYGIRTETDNSAAVTDADIVVLAVKPQIMRDVCEAMRDTIQVRKPLIISVAAGLTSATLEEWLGGELPLIRGMPNTPALVGAGATGLFANTRVNADQRATATQLLETVGLVEWVDNEELLDAVTAVSGSGPAYFFLIFEAMEAAGIELGLAPETARRLALQTGYGAASMALASPTAPAQLKRNVMSPQGTTERAIQHFEDAQLQRIFLDAMQACTQRAREMASEFSKQ